MAPKRVTRSSVRGGATPRGGRTGGRGGRGGRGAANDTSNPSNDGGRTGGRGGRGGGHGVENNDNNDGGNTDFEAIIARQLENFLPTIVTQVGDHMNNLANQSLYFTSSYIIPCYQLFPKLCQHRSTSA
jgi:hypothetical protein